MVDTRFGPSVLVRYVSAQVSPETLANSLCRRTRPRGNMLRGAFHSCMRLDGRNISQSNSIAYHYYGGDAARVVGTKGLLVWIVVVGWSIML